MNIRDRETKLPICCPAVTILHIVCTMLSLQSMHGCMEPLICLRPKGKFELTASCALLCQTMFMLVYRLCCGHLARLRLFLLFKQVL